MLPRTSLTLSVEFNRHLNSLPREIVFTVLSRAVGLNGEQLSRFRGGTSFSPRTADRLRALAALVAFTGDPITTVPR